MVVDQTGVEEQDHRADGSAVGRCVHLVDEALALSVAFREINAYLVAGDGNFNPDPDRYIEFGSVVVSGALAVVGPVGDLPDFLAYRPLRAVHHFVHAGHDYVPAVVPEHLLQAVLAYFCRGDHRRVIDPHRFPEADVVPDQFHHVGPLAPLLHNLDGRNAQTFGVDVESVGEISSRKGAPGIHLMRPAQREEQQFAFEEDGPEEPPVGQVVVETAVVGIVGQEYVAGVDIPFEPLQNELHRKLAAHELRGEAHGNRHGAPARVPDSHRVVVKLPDEVAHRGALQHVAHFVADPLESVPDGRQRDRIYLRISHGNIRS